MSSSRLPWLHRLDMRVFERIARSHTPALDTALPRLSRAANHGVLWLATGAVLAAIGGPRGRAAALRGLFALAVASAVVNVPVKLGARRHRPPTDLVPLVRRLRRTPTTWSFPSGHSASAAAFATGAALGWSRAALPVGALAASVGWSRVYVGVHYPSDVLAGGTIGAAAAVATLRPWPRTPSLPPGPRPAPRRQRTRGDGVAIVVNRDAGPAVWGGGTEDRLRDALPEAKVVAAAAGDLEATLDEVATEADVLGIAGGDGSMSTAARRAQRAGIPLLVLPAGTRNYLARDLGLFDVDDAVAALDDGRTVPVEVAQAGSEAFVNTLAAGAYPHLIDTRERLEPEITEWPATVAALVSALGRAEPLRLRIDGRDRRLWMLWVGNCRYEPGGFVRGIRPHLADGLFDVRLVAAERRASRTRLLGAVLAGALETSPGFERRLVRRLSVTGTDGALRLARDGETFDAPTALTIEKRRDPVRVFAAVHVATG